MFLKQQRDSYLKKGNKAEFVFSKMSTSEEKKYNKIE